MNVFYKVILFLFVYALLNGCVPNTEVSEKKVIQSPEAKVEKEKEDMLWILPNWCQNIKQELFEFRACGIAKSPSLQMSRTRSELDARKQIIKILNNECNNSENVSIDYLNLLTGFVLETPRDSKLVLQDGRLAHCRHPTISPQPGENSRGSEIGGPRLQAL